MGMQAYYQRNDVTIYHGDNREVIPSLADASIDAIVCDPPYELGFMGKSWDSTGIAYNVELWRQCLRVLKPGGHLLAFGGSRTYHRLACAIEDAGFEVRDQIMWIYGSGFPKSMDVSKAIDKAAGAEREIAGTNPNYRAKHATAENTWRVAEGRKPSPQSSPVLTAPATDDARQWSGWGTALKPAHEPVVVARKPLAGTVAANVLQHGTGAINIDGCRIGDFVNTTPPGTDRYNKANHEQGYRPSAYGREGEASADRRYTDNGATNFAALPGPRGGSPSGRFPANVIHDGSDEVVSLFPESAGQQGDVRGTEPSRTGGEGTNCYGEYGPRTNSPVRGETGSAARFFYTAKADKEDRTHGNNHPTVKPTDLMRYLVRLVCPIGGTVLDPFTGSGTTLYAARMEGCKAIGIELNADYCAIAKRRLKQEVLL